MSYTTHALTVSEAYEGFLPYVKIENLQNFDVAKAFDCGQCFRFDKVEDTSHEVEFFGVAFGRAVSFAQNKNTLYIYGATLLDYEEIWRHYLALDVDYEEIISDIKSRSDTPALATAIDYGRGIRILHQEPWETVCSFIISQNNNIPRIKKIIAALSEAYGERINIPEGMERHGARGNEHSFPTPASLADAGVDAIFALRTGFRAKYIFDAALRASRGKIDYEMLKSSHDTAKCASHLCEIKGVGPKVAACALLFGFEKYDAFPIDVWIKKVIAKYFTPDFTPETLGPYAGIAQQFLFYYERYIVE